MSAAPNSLTVPLVSVVMPVHNGARWLGETLQSLYAQTESRFEIVLVDDASTDDLRQVLTAHADERLQVIHLPRNVGVSAARNQGIALARGRYIAFCDADDLCQPQRLESQLTFLEQHPETGLCGSAFTCFDTEERETVLNPTSNEEIRTALMQGNCFGLSTTMGRADVLKAQRFDTALSVAEDYDLWTRLAAAGVPLANLSDSLIRYRWHPQQASRTKSARLDQATRRIRGRYCASLLGDARLQERLKSETVALEDLQRVADRIATQSIPTARDFRFLLAWIYQLLPAHGLREWWHWTRIQKKLRLDLDRTYRINTAVLALLPGWLTRRHFDTLIKLKR